MEMRARLDAEYAARFEAMFQEKLPGALKEAVEAYMVQLLANPACTPPIPSPEQPTMPRPPSYVHSTDAFPRPPSQSTPCLLAVIDPETLNKVVVANGTVYLTDRIMHGVQMNSGYYKVCLNLPLSDHYDKDLPVASMDGETTKVGDAAGHFLAWPEELIIIETGVPPALAPEPTPTPIPIHVPDMRKKSIESAASKAPLAATSMIKAPIVAKGSEEQTGDGMDILRLAYQDDPTGAYDSTTIVLPPPYGYITEPTQNIVTKSDVAEFLRMDWLNVSIIQVWQQCLRETYSYSFKNFLVSFLCPGRFNGIEIKRNSANVKNYIRGVFNFEREIEGRQTKFIMAPYLEGKHWSLYVIELQAGRGYFFDSSQFEPKKVHKMNGTMILDMIFREYVNLGGRVNTRNRPAKLHWETIMCPQQPTGSECGYYVMKFMLEIITKYAECNVPLHMAYEKRDAPYLQEEELDLIRDDWAKFFNAAYLTAN